MPQQPHPFFMTFFVKSRERFDYYGMQSVLTVFFVKQLRFSQEQAFVTLGAFAALVYGPISIGGYVGDHLLGTRRTIVFGTPVLVIGYLMTSMSLLRPDLISIVLGTIAVGNDLLKANLAGLLSKCYPPKGPRLDGVSVLFYMSINIGLLIALPLTPAITGKLGYPVTYNLRGAGLIITLSVYIARRGMVKGIGSEPDFRPISFSKLLYVLLGSVVMTLACAWLMHSIEVTDLVLIILSIVVTTIFFRQAFKLDKTGRNKIFVVSILILEAMVFYILYAQMSMPLNFLAINNVYHEILGFSVNPVSFQALNPFWMVLASPMLADICTHLGNEGKNLSMSMKFILSMFMCSLGFLTAVTARTWLADAQGLTSPWFIVLVHLFQSLGELFTSAFGLAVTATLVLQHLVGFTLGIWSLTRAAAFLLSGYVAAFAVVSDNATDPLETLPAYANVFDKINPVTLGVVVVVLLMMPWPKHMIAMPEGH